MSLLTTMRSASAASAAMSRSGSENVWPDFRPASNIKRQRNKASSVTGSTRPTNNGRSVRSSHCPRSDRRAGSVICSMPKRTSAKVTSLVNNTSPGCPATNARTFWAGRARRSSDTTLVSISQPLKVSHPELAISPTAFLSLRFAAASWPERQQDRAQIPAS